MDVLNQLIAKYPPLGVIIFFLSALVVVGNAYVQMYASQALKDKLTKIESMPGIGWILNFLAGFAHDQLTPKTVATANKTDASQAPKA